MSSSTPSSEFVADTVAVVVWLEHRRMGANARSAFDLAEQGAAQIYIPAIVFAELGYLTEKGRIQTSLNELLNQMSKHSAIVEQPLTAAIVNVAFTINDIPELHDRLIAATAKHMNTALITTDHVIQASSSVETIW